MEIAIVVINIILLFYLTRMALASRQVTVHGKVGQVWFVAGFFIVLGLIRLLQDHSWISLCQTLMIMALGVLYSRMKSGFSDKGIVLLGNVYPWDRITRLDVTVQEETSEVRVEFTVKKVSRFIYFPLDQQDAVEAMATRYEQEQAELQLKQK